LRSKLESHHNCEIVVIDAESGDYFLGETFHEANEKARKKYPNNVFYAIKVGYPQFILLAHIRPSRQTYERLLFGWQT
jgi:hypothetical protein